MVDPGETKVVLGGGRDDGTWKLICIVQSASHASTLTVDVEFGSHSRKKNLTSKFKVEDKIIVFFIQIK